jgi:hypothetical protein
VRILGLPGRLPETFDHMQALLASLAEASDVVEAQRYGFWDGGVADPDFAGEARRAAASAPESVVAKSLGCLVAMEACAVHGLTPRACVFIGVPLRRLEAEGRADMLARHASAIPTLFIQQPDDPTGRLADLARRVPGAACRTASGDDHVYSDLAELARFVRSWDGWRRGAGGTG